MLIEVDNVVYGNVSSFPLEPLLFTQFYVGGLPADTMSGMMTMLDDDAQSFGGCVRRFTIDNRNVDLSHDVMMAYNVDLDGCPREASNSGSLGSSFEDSAEGSSVDSSSEQPTLRANVSCVENNIDTLYNGMEHSYTSSAIDGFFTRYMYKVSESIVMKYQLCDHFTFCSVMQ